MKLNQTQRTVKLLGLFTCMCTCVHNCCTQYCTEQTW